MNEGEKRREKDKEMSRGGHSAQQMMCQRSALSPDGLAVEEKTG